MKTRPGTFSTRYKTTALAVLMAAFGMSAYGWTISGTVKSTSGGAAISGVAVTVKDSSKYTATTDNTGAFKIEAPVSILDSRVISNPGSYSVQISRGELIIKSPRNESLKLSLVDCSGRTLWTANAIANQGVAKVAFPSMLGRGAVFLLIHHAEGIEYKSVGWGLDGGFNIASPRSVSSAAVAATYPTILFKKDKFHDTSFTMTSAEMSNVSVVMSPSDDPVCPLPTNISWTSSGILVDIHPDASHQIVSVKDPTIQKYNGKYLIYCTVYNTSNKTWSMQFIQFDDFSKANSATVYFMDQTSGFSGYKCAPELFYFEPQKLWYLIWQQQDPAYSTTTTPDNPKSWSAPKRFYANGLGSIKLPIDYFPIADDQNFYLFFTGDDGNVYRAKTKLSDFPNGFGTPTIIKTLATSIIFEASCHFKVKGTTNTYLHLVEGMGSTGRVYSAWTSEGIEGQWRDYKVGAGTPFAGRNNVTYAAGATDWSDDISHGELIRDNPSQKQEVDPCNFQLLYQGRDPSKNPAYEMLPYKLGLLTAK